MNDFKSAAISLIALIAVALPAEAGEYNKAEKNLQEARGLTFMKKYTQADAVYTKALPQIKTIYGENTEKLARFYSEWAMNAHLEGNHKKAIELYQKALSMKTDNSTKAHWYDMLAQSYEQAKQYDKAISAYKDALKLSGDFKFKKVYYYQKLAFVYEKASNYSSAETAWKEALKYSDYDLGSRKDYVKLAQKHPLGPKHALEDSVDTKVLELFDSLHGLGAFYAERGRLKEAAPLFKRAKSVNDVWIPMEFKRPDFYFDYANYLAKQNQTKEAEKYKSEGQRIKKELQKRRKQVLQK